MEKQRQKGITLIALIVTIVVLLILAGTTINLVIGENGIIARAQEAAFRQEMAQINDQVEMRKMECMMDGTTLRDIFIEPVKITDVEKWKPELRMEIIYWGDYHQVGISKITRDYAKKQWKEILLLQNGNTGIVSDLFYIDKTTAGGEEHKYIYDMKVDRVYKIPTSKVGRHKVHSIRELNYQLKGEGEKAPIGTLVSDNSNQVTVGTITHYEPDLSGFILENTKLVYYSKDNKLNIEIPAAEYLKNGKQRTIEKAGTTYELYDYEKQKWANILVENQGAKSYWVWIPRYAYKIPSGTTNTEVKFLSLEEEPPEGYILHSDFEDNKKGIWASKYEPIQQANQERHDFPYYIPDMTGYNEDNTYVEVYNKATKGFEEKRLRDIQDLNKFALENNWFDYQNSIWANIKTINPTTNVEAWWVWIPRYAYNITGNETTILFVDKNNHPLTGENLPSNYVVHPAFGKDKKGIWVSKYEPVQKVVDLEKTNNVNPPNLVGFNVDNTYIEIYEGNGRFKEQKLRDILSTNAIINSQNIVEKSDIDFSKINGNWYAYDKKMWANIKIVNPTTKVESWWVWIPRYAYNITGIDSKIIFLDSNGNPRDGGTLPSNYVPHSAFNENKEGIWASKYEPINK